MRFRSILLRLLLCLALLANGTTAAFASAQMAVGGVSAAAASSDGDAPPCHDGMAAMDDGAMSGDHGTPGSHADDCCLPGACLCDCIATVAALPTIDHAKAMTRPASAPGAVAFATRASPLLAPSIRPPIGQAIA